MQINIINQTNTNLHKYPVSCDISFTHKYDDNGFNKFPEGATIQEKINQVHKMIKAYTESHPAVLIAMGGAAVLATGLFAVLNIANE